MLERTIDVNVERLMKAVTARATEEGFTPVTHRLDIVGLCADCSKEAKSSSA